MQALAIKSNCEIETHLRQVLTFLRGKVRKDYKYSSVEEFVLKEGRFMGQRSPKSDEYPRGTPKECFRNAYNLCHKLRYCEGYARYALSVIPLQHAWLLDSDGNVIDTTWAAGEEYFGLEFPTEFVIKTVLSRGSFGVIDNWEMRWPLLRRGFLP
jgi:hypothetical protein